VSGRDENKSKPTLNCAQLRSRMRWQFESDCFAGHRAQTFHLALKGTYTKLQTACYGSTLSALIGFSHPPGYLNGEIKKGACLPV